MISSIIKTKCIFTAFICMNMVHRIPSEPSKQLTDFLLCRHCGTDIASAASIVNLKSPAATTRVNQTVFGLENVLVQTIDNPLKIQFKVITTLETYCLARGKWSTDHSWFPGYAWKACTCSRCGHHLGWAFEPLATANPEKERPSAKGFFAVILDNVISELFSNSLLITPQTTTIR